MQEFNLVKEIESMFMPRVLGPLTEGAWISLGGGMGFYVPQADFDALKQLANQTRRVQFLTITPAGEPLHGTREDCLEKGNGMIAWIAPD